ncbi:MAG: hypothetical protein OS112_01435 [Methanoregula sp.]|nr:MAG: hypothetical protein OS112_01435 [Methanoregula sp.]
MPRRPTRTEEGVPLFLVPHVMMQGIRKHGGEVEWAEVRKASHHYYTVSIRTRPVKREFRGVCREQVPAPAEGETV